ncbi:hypothetical protein J2S71_000628 [Olsenella profusa DSM 13989]|uniref:hypothetical protein n=1 Tax=Olsenella profusa TaxID=138595 RepID=UPI00277E30DF|nr:hypothetical protein [Olsenella profusa]MDP9858932.1 hypothetical protein [Olsenella profusa DSM 13989]
MGEWLTGHDAQPGQGTMRPARAISPAGAHATPSTRKPPNPYLRAENEDDDGYDPFSDRPARHEPLFERDPWM